MAKKIKVVNVEASDEIGKEIIKAQLLIMECADLNNLDYGMLRTVFANLLAQMCYAWELDEKEFCYYVNLQIKTTVKSLKEGKI